MSGALLLTPSHSSRQFSLGALWGERIESLYLNARALTEAAGLEILTVQDGEFLTGDVPALTVRAGHARVGVLGGIALAEAQSVFLPHGLRHVAALGRADQLIHLTSAQAAEVNARQLAGAIDYVYLRPGSPLIDTVRSFAEQRKAAQAKNRPGQRQRERKSRSSGLRG